MITIGVDAHNLENERTGVGRYLENLLRCYANDRQLQKNIHFRLYFKGSLPRDDFLRSPLFSLVSLQVLPRPSFSLYFLFSLPLRAYRDRVDVMFFPGYMVPPLYRGTSVLVLHDISFERFPELFPLRYRFPYRALGRRGARMSKAICTISEFSKKEIKDVYQVLSSKIYVTPLGVDESFHRADGTEIERAKKAFHIKKEYIFFLGQIFQRRHVTEAMRAFEMIAPDFPNVQFLVVGQNRTKPFVPIDEIADEINKNLGRKAIIRRTYVSNADLVPLYSGAKAGVYLSDYEGFGLPPLEFLACGTPVLAPDSTSLAQTLQGMQVVINDPASVEEISKKLASTLKDDKMRQRIALEGPRYAAKFRWEDCARKTLDVLTGVASRKK